MTFYIEYYDSKDNLLDCSDEYSNKQTLLKATRNEMKDFHHALIIEKTCVGNLIWELKEQK